MAKSKTSRRDPGLLDKMMANLHKPKVTDDRLAILAVELGLAGGEVLQEHFGFTTAQTAKWLDLMLDRAKVNRATALARQAVKEIDGDANHA